MKTELKKGDRVRVYGWVNMHHSPYKARGGGPATITYVEDENFVHVKFDDDETHYSADPKQLRKLRVKRKPEPEKRERREVWIKDDVLINLFATGAAFYIDAVIFRDARKEFQKFTEIRPGESVVSLETLAKAWVDWVNPNLHGLDRGTFPAFCKALLPKEAPVE